MDSFLDVDGTALLSEGEGPVLAVVNPVRFRYSGSSGFAIDLDRDLLPRAHILTCLAQLITQQRMIETNSVLLSGTLPHNRLSTVQEINRNSHVIPRPPKDQVWLDKVEI
jgi:hypothetical protein